MSMDRNRTPGEAQSFEKASLRRDASEKHCRVWFGALKVRDAACRILERAEGLAQRIDDLSPESRNCPGICEVPTVFQT